MRATSLILALLLVALPAEADDAARLEQECIKEVDKAAQLLKKVQEGSLTHAKALEELAEVQAKVQELERLDPKAAEPMSTELRSIEFWIKKMAPLFGPEEAAEEKPEPKPEPEPEPRPDPEPKPEPKPEPGPEEKPEWKEPILPDDPAGRAELLATLLSDAEPKNRSWAAAHAPKAPRRNLVDRLFALLLSDPDENVRRAAQDGLVRTRHSRVLDGLVDNVGKAQGPALDLLFGILEARPDPRSVEALFQIVLDHEEPLGSVNERSKDRMKEFRKEIEDSFAQGWRARVFAVFKSWPGATVVDGVGGFVKKSSGRAKQEALLTLGLYGDGRGAIYAVPFLTKSDNPLRATALATAEFIGKPAVPYLAAGLASDSTKLWCYQALLNITEARVGARAQDWMAWWRTNR